MSSLGGSDICRNDGGSLFQRGGTATCTSMERLENLSDGVTEGRNSVRVDEEDLLERGGWILNN